MLSSKLSPPQATSPQIIATKPDDTVIFYEIELEAGGKEYEIKIFANGCVLEEEEEEED